jgi:hypothetical protein
MQSEFFAVMMRGSVLGMQLRFYRSVIAKFYPNLYKKKKLGSSIATMPVIIQFLNTLAIY